MVTTKRFLRSLRRGEIVLFGITFFLNIASWALVLWKIPYTTEPIFLHYNIYFGIDLTGSWWKIFTTPILGIAIIIINTLLAIFATDHPFIQRMIAVITLVLECMTFFAAILIVRLNI